MSFGAVYPWAYWPLAVGCAAIGIHGIAETRAWTNDRLRKLACALGGVGLAIAVQAIAFRTI